MYKRYHQDADIPFPSSSSTTLHHQEISPLLDDTMPGWSRQRADSKLAAWAKSQDLATVERELERTEKDIRRSGSVSLNPEYVLKRQQERARARDATGRLSSIGLRLELGPFMFDHPPPLPSSTPSKGVAGSIKSQNIDQREIIHLRNELSKLKTRERDLEAALITSERKRDEERKAHERERKLLVHTVRKFKAEVEEGWSRLIRLREKYEGPSFPTESGRTNSSRQIYQTDESFERVYRATTANQPKHNRRVSIEESPDKLHKQPSSSSVHLQQPSHSSSLPPLKKLESSAINNHPSSSSRPRTASILKNPLAGGASVINNRTRRTSFS
ncbi:hypothetical protein MJO28_010833 [Puccinia striiformis f. sp. tritici]|uniref:Uncharacterized protein n=3 Tax=Puccinia striiformis TaxID=27350 RepID=A0A2S4UTT2_9BASI|nr:hypothetical protein MJO28_010833 [Puccinia striiformis f. sp. tritici]POW00697.1 hypothetical protein PSTT_12968 [Puccinia striiformis]